MGMEILDSKVAHQSVECGSFIEPIKFGSHGLDEPKKEEVIYPQNAVDEWPEPKQIHSFWLVKYRSFEDQKLRAKFELYDKELQKKHQSRSQLIEKLREKKGERAKIISELKALVDENKQYWSKIDEKRKEIEPLQHALGQLRGAGSGDRDKDRRSILCSSEEELNDVLKSYQYRIQHESIPLSEEKQILREIKQLESTREKVVSNAAIREKIQESMGEKTALQDQVKLIGVGLDDVRKNQKVVKAKLRQLDEIKEGIDNEIRSLEEELTEATQKRDKTFENIQELRRHRDEGNLPFYENRSLLIKAKELAAKKDVGGLRDLSEREVTKFFSLWSSTKALREEYEKRILPSLDSRQLSRDGRIRNPGEQLILSVVAPTVLSPDEAAAEVVVGKGSVKQSKDKSNSSPAEAEVVAEASLVEKEKDSEKETSAKKQIDVEEYFVPEKVKKIDPNEVVDEKKLKEKKREEEMAKAKQALERKKKMAEKAAAKAAIKAQKEAEKKEKEREKRLKKKTGGACEEQTEAVTFEAAVSEQQKVVEEEAVHQTALAPEKKSTDVKNAIKYRKRSSKGLDSLPKTLIKRKKGTTDYWMYGSVAGVTVAVILLAIVGFQYLM